MRIGIDAHAVGSRLGGNETYIAGLLDALGRLESPHEFIAYFASEETAKPWRNRYGNISTRVLKMSSSLPRLLLELPARAAADRIGALHVQYVAPPVCFVPVVATIHDICYEYFPQFFSRSEVIQFKAAIRWTARRASRVVTISENSKRDIVNTYGIAPDKISVTYLGVDVDRFRLLPANATVGTTLDKYGVKSPYVLAVGNLQPRKNLLRLLDAFVNLKQGRPELPHRLVLVGKAAFRHTDVFKRVRERGLDDQVFFTGYVPDEDLPALYQGAAVFAYPSLYEGFGLPVAEAMACGVPVLASDRAAMPEVAGNAAILVDPDSTRSITDGLSRILTNPELSAALSARSVERARRFTWEAAARGTLAAYEKALEKKSRW